MIKNPKPQTMQKAADTGKSVHLSASAGSGKTRALKERYLNLLDRLDRSGLSIDQAVAITFTDKAAAEINERVMHDLPEVMLKKIIRGRQDLRISTIHSFCMNILKRYPLEAGLPPDFGVLDSRDQASKIQKAVEDALEEFDRATESMAQLSGFTVDELISIIEFLLSIRSRLKRLEIDAGGPDGLVRSVQNGMELDIAETELAELVTGREWQDSLQEMERILKAAGDSYYDNRGHEHALLSDMRDPGTAYSRATFLFPIYFTMEGSPRKAAKLAAKAFKSKDRHREYETLFFKIQELLYRLKNNYLRARAGSEAVGLLRLYLRAEEHYREAKLREGLLDFDDLEIYAYRLLRSVESPDILYWLDRKILHFLVDEFQDTSDIQWAILDKLTEEFFSGQGADKLMPPTLFVVGDAKQSIYRFREANYRLIDVVRQKMEQRIPVGSREILTLDKNFRSTPEIVETINRIFAGLWGESYKPSESDRAGHKGSVRLLEVAPNCPVADEETLPHDVPGTLTEAEILARELQSLIAKKTVVYERTDEDPAGWKERPAEYGDCAILIQSRTRLKEYETALQAQGVPYRVVGGIGFYEEDEIQALINVLFYLWNRDDRLAFAAALKAPLFGLTDKDIFELMQDEGTMAEALLRRRPDMGRMLEYWRGLAKLVPLSVLIHRIVRDTGAYIRFGRLNPQAIFNIDKLLDTAREFDRRGYTTLQDFVAWVRNIRQTEQREAAADMNLPGFHGSVSILTVHKAKGLEYAVVFLPGLNQFARSLTSGPQALLEETGGKIRMAVREVGNPVYEDLWRGEHGEQEELRREHQRLLYVSMTRARDHLIMLGTLGNGKTPIKQNTWLDCLDRTLPLARPKAAARAAVYSYPDWRMRALEQEPAGERRPGQDRTLAEDVDFKIVIDNISPLPPSGAVEWKRVTDFIEQKQEAPLELFSTRTDAGRVSPLTRGSVLHKCLEEHTTKGAFDLNRILEDYPEVPGLEAGAKQSFTDDIESVLQAVLGAADFAWVFKRREDSFSELPFLYTKEHSFISGIIDRVVIQDGIGFVIDYKSIRIEDEENLSSWINHYRPQIQIYCEAIKQIFSLERVEGYLLFLDSNRLQLTTKV
jgi:ATP-dependent helicase/nuclease subunit A